MTEEYLTTVEVAQICRASPETVRYWRWRGEGPPSFKLGRKVLYAADDVTSWLEDARRNGRGPEAA